MVVGNGFYDLLFLSLVSFSEGDDGGFLSYPLHDPAGDDFIPAGPYQFVFEGIFTRIENENKHIMPP